MTACTPTRTPTAWSFGGGSVAKPKRRRRAQRPKPDPDMQNVMTCFWLCALEMAGDRRLSPPEDLALVIGVQRSWWQA